MKSLVIILAVLVSNLALAQKSGNGPSNIKSVCEEEGKYQDKQIKILKALIDQVIKDKDSDRASSYQESLDRTEDQKVRIVVFSAYVGGNTSDRLLLDCSKKTLVFSREIYTSEKPKKIEVKAKVKFNEANDLITISSSLGSYKAEIFGVEISKGVKKIGIVKDQFQGLELTDDSQIEGKEAMLNTTLLFNAEDKSRLTNEIFDTNPNFVIERQGNYVSFLKEVSSL